LKKLLATLFLLGAALSQVDAALDLSVFSFKGYEGKGALEFTAPEDMLLLPDGQILVADQRNNRLQLLSADGEFVRAIPQLVASEPLRADGKKQNSAKVLLPPRSATSSVPLEVSRKFYEEVQRYFPRPTGLALDNKGQVFVTFMESDLIAIVDLASGKVTGTLGRSGRGQGELFQPLDIDISHDGRIAVAEGRNKRVQIMNDTGKCLKELVYQEESKKGALNAVAPRGVHWLNNGNLVVSYPTFNQVVCWEPKEGKIVWRYGSSKGTEKGMLNSPSYINRSLDGNLLISDTLNHRIVEITSEGKFFEHYGRRGSAPGRLLMPRGLALNSDETLLIIDQGNSRVHFFQPGQVTITLREAKQLALKDDWVGAMSRIERVLYLQPNNEQARDLMINALYYFGNKAFVDRDFFKAADFYRRVLKYNPDDANIPQKLDAIFWAENQGLIASIVFGIIAVIAGLIIVWILKVLLTRFIFTNTQE